MAPGAEEIPPATPKSKISVEVTGEIPKARKMPQWDLEDDVVISGIAGRFPEADNYDEFIDNLYKSLNMVTIDNRRWPVGKSDNLIIINLFIYLINLVIYLIN